MSADIATANDQPRSNLVDVPEEKRQGFSFLGTHMSWLDWATIYKSLGQELAKRMREYPGPSTDDDVPPEGGTPVAAAKRGAA